MSDFMDAISQLSGQEPRENISKIKGLVKEQLEATDARARVEVTDHFNHSFVPDFVLSWPDVADKRSVFLRTSFDTADLTQDLRTLAREHAILMPLAQVQSADSELATTLANMSQESQTLIADPYGLEVFEDESEASPVVSLLSHAVLQGGRGVIGAERAQRVSDEVSDGFQAAQTADRERTGAAVETAELLLDSYRASQMNRLLHAVWVGSGASGTTFPTTAGVTSALDVEALRFILELPEFEEPTFWHRLGGGLTTERLCQLGNFSATTNLQRLLAGNVGRLTAKACRVFPSEATEPLQWSIVSGCLSLQLATSRAMFAPHSVTDLPGPAEGTGISVDDLRERAEVAEASISEVRVSDGDVTLSYSAEDRDDITHDEALNEVGGVLEDGVVVSALVRGTVERADLRCTFRTGTGAGNSSSRFSISQLAGTALPMLTDMEPRELDFLRALFESREAATEAAEVHEDTPGQEASSES